MYINNGARTGLASHITLLGSQLPGVCVSLLLLEVLLLVRHKRLWRVRLMWHGQCSQSGTLSMLISGKSNNLFSQIDGRCSAAVSVAMRGRKPDNGKQRSQARTCDEIVFATF